MLRVCPAKQVTADIRMKCTKYFSGTSAAAPLGAGIVALLLEAKYVLIRRRVHSLSYGFIHPGVIYINFAHNYDYRFSFKTFGNFA